MTNQIITLENRKRLTVSDVKSVESFTDNEVKLYTENGDLTIKGEGFVPEGYDNMSGDFSMCGKICSMSFTTDKKHLPDNFISRLFR